MFLFNGVSFVCRCCAYIFPPYRTLTQDLFVVYSDGQLTTIAVSQAGEVKADGQTVTDAATGQPAQITSWGWHQPTSLSGDPQQNVLNLLAAAGTAQGTATTQPDQLTQAAQIAGLQPVMVSQQPMETQESQNADQAQGQSNSREDKSRSSAETSSAQTLPNGPEGGATSLQSLASAHNLYNSYGFNPWSAYTTATTEAGGDGKTVVYNRESLLETELQHLRSALSEKTQEVQRLTQELEKAYNIIEQLKQQNPTAIIQLPVTQAPPGVQLITTAALPEQPSNSQSPPAYSNPSTTTAT